MTAITEHDSSYGDMNWDSKTIVAANGLQKMFTSFNFIISFIATMNAMAIIKPISVKLQKRNNDIINAYTEVEVVLSSIRGSAELLHSWYVQAEVFATEVGVVPDVPRTASRQRNRDNVEYNTAEEYYHRSIILPLLDNLIQQMKERFGHSQAIASKFLHLVPSVMCNSTINTSLDDLVTFIMMIYVILHSLQLSSGGGRQNGRNRMHLIIHLLSSLL